MNKTAIILTSTSVLVISLIIAGLLYLKQYRPEYYWRATYKYDSDQPYGTEYLYALLKETYQDDFHLLQKKPSVIIEEDATNTMLFYIGYNTYYDSVTVEWFKEFLHKGNNICIASDVLPFRLLNEIYELDTFLFYTDTIISETITTTFDTNYPKQYSFHHQNVKDTTNFIWKYFSDETITNYWKNYMYLPISTIDEGKVNFLEISYGKGNLYIHTTPLFLTNYFFTSEQGFRYANDLFANLGSFDTFYWDDFSRISRTRFNGGGSLDKSNPLEFIMANEALRWTWYLFLLAMVLFMVFRLKRRQMPIKVLTQDKNTSVEYAKAVGLLHYKTSGHLDLANRLITIFHHYINRKYGITQHKERDEQVKLVSLHSGLPTRKIEEIFKLHFRIKFNPDPEVEDLLKLHSNLEYFYKNCK